MSLLEAPKYQAATTAMRRLIGAAPPELLVSDAGIGVATVPPDGASATPPAGARIVHVAPGASG